MSRRSFLWGCAASSMMASTPVLHAWSRGQRAAELQGAARHVLPLNERWWFEGRLADASAQVNGNHAAATQITLPHAVTKLSWQGWNPETWEHVWGYRRSFEVPDSLRGLRLFLHFDRVMAGTSPVLNGHSLPQHLGGFLPFEYEVTDLVRRGENTLAVAVDARWLDAPPSGSPKGPGSIDYLLPGGINGGVSLRAVPEVFLQSVFAKPVDVLDAARRVDVICQVDAGGKLPARVRVEATLSKNGRRVASRSKNVQIESPHEEVTLSLDRLGDVRLWDVDHPELYDVEVTLFVEGKPLHRYKTRIGFRAARFEVDGFYLNGKRLQLFGLNRHELYPYFGFAASERTMRRDAELLKRKFNCNMVRCSHYPQSEAFMNACDELGILVWEETPGFQYIGGTSFQELVLRDVREMVMRDRNHASVIVWGVRLNESPNDPALYRRTKEIATQLDGTRQTSGTMTPSSEKTWQTEWHQDVFAFDDYHASKPGVVGIRPPLPGVPYLVSESVGQFNYPAGKGFNLRYRRDATPEVQQDQALFHAAAHDKAAGYAGCAGLLGWCAFDYPSVLHAYDAMKYPGIADFFRLPKLGASYYESQVSPHVRPVIAPDFYWDFGERMPSGPGERAAIFSNCERLELLVNGKRRAVLHPDREGFPHTAYPPFFADLKMDGAEKPELEIRGYVGDAMVLSRSFSSDSQHDKLWLEADAAELFGDGSDSARLAFGVVDQYGAPRAFAGGTVKLEIEGPGEIAGDNPFDLSANGGMGAVWIRTLPGQHGAVRIRAVHSSLQVSPEVRLQILPGDYSKKGVE
uniref:Glycoside hydrolase family 2 protein n=1 Tax=Acidobacterium capsulatum TaxID=33075 RepID=A0A7V5CT83_9BACT